MTVDFSRDLMIGMLRKGATGNQILQILEVVTTPQEVAENTETDNESVSADVINA